MRLLNVVPCGVMVELDAHDCLAISDALSVWNDRPGNQQQVKAMHTAFLAMAVLAAHDTNTDTDIPEEDLIANTREVWGNVDTTHTSHRKVTLPPVS